MKKIVKTWLLIAILIMSAAMLFASVKTYQWTGNITEIKDGALSVDKGGVIWKFDADAGLTKGKKTGDKVTVTYKMIVASKGYQYTGKITEIKNGTFSVDKAGDVWQFEGETGGKKVGDKITVIYKLVATAVK